MNITTAETVTEPGLYRMSAEAYFKDPAPAPSLTQSLAKVLLARSPAHAWVAHPRLGKPADEDSEPEKYDRVKAVGNAAHRLLIGAGKEIVAAEFSDWRTKDAKAFKADTLAAGKTPILGRDLESAMQIVISVTAQLEIMDLKHLFNPMAGAGEVVAAWQEEGLWLRTMIDWLSDDLRDLTDVKTTGLSVAPHAIGKLAADAGWDLQAATHERALDALEPDGRGRRTFRFVAIEQEPPYAMTVVEMPEHWLEMGRRKLGVALRIWRQCMETDTWPAYPLAPVVPEYPGWSEARWLDREVSEFADLAAPHGRDVSGRALEITDMG